MRRNFSDWLDAYLNFMDDKWAPGIYHQWTGLSVLSTGVERRVYLRVGKHGNMHLNMYLLLGGEAGVGKSSAIVPGTKFIQDYNKTTRLPLYIAPDNVTVEKLITMLPGMQKNMPGIKPGATKFDYHTSCLFAADEGSASLKSIQGGGEIFPILTKFYDCPDLWTKGTIAGGDIISINNLCFGLIAGCTFDYLGKIITGDSIYGGFASRFIYVIFKDKLIRQVEWQGGENLDDPAVDKAHQEYRMLLLADYAQIASLCGEIRGTKEFAAAYKVWYRQYQDAYHAHPNPKMKALLARKPTNALKLAGLMSVSAGNDMVMTLAHWERALAWLNENEKSLPAMLRESKATDIMTQEGLNNAIIVRLHKGSQSRAKMQSDLVMDGFDSKKVDATIGSMIAGNKIKSDAGKLTLLINPDFDV